METEGSVSLRESKTRYRARTPVHAFIPLVNREPFSTATAYMVSSEKLEPTLHREPFTNVARNSADILVANRFTRNNRGGARQL